jgi:methylated-DNA-protein-cysteine methyltransferase related protein
MQNDSSQFKHGVVRVVSAIPFGKVMSYGQVALYLGLPRAARQVGWSLSKMGDAEDLAWWRVVNNQGRISIKGSQYTAEEQRALLIQEGVFIEDDFTLDIEKYRYLPEEELLKKWGLDTFYIETVSKKLPYSSFFPGR